MFKTLKQPINLVFVTQVFVVFLVAFGILPRTSIIPLAVLIAIFILRADLETSTAFFIRSVPLFVAIPFTSYFDSFNIWRIAAGLIFLKWIYVMRRRSGNSFSPLAVPRTAQPWQKNSVPRSLLKKAREFPLATFLLTFLILSMLSLFAAEDLFVGVKRIIYLVNLILAPLVIHDLVKKNPVLIGKFLVNIFVSGVIVAGVGLAQLITAYSMSISAFLEFWGGTVQLGFYGSQWSSIALEANTWFAYFGDQLSLRIFSTLTDSHSFPVYILMTIPALLALALHRVQGNQNSQKTKFGLFKELKQKFSLQRPGIEPTPKLLKINFKKLICPRTFWLIILLLIFYLLAILSGTRGIWLAVLGPFLILPFLIKKSEGINKNILKHLGLFLIPFFILFFAAFPIMGSDQFGLKKEDSYILAKRIRSIINLEETSNSGRLAIWKETMKSIIRHPFLGVGIGNFPSVLSQSVDSAKAGSSAHNLYLNIAAETGLVGLLAALGILAIILKRAWYVFTGIDSQGSTFLEVQDRILIKVYGATFILYSCWILFYSLTDAVLFDERVFLIFAINSAIILGLHEKSSRYN